jgi:formylglycine-generating enzyme required for sulfatase activity
MVSVPAGNFTMGSAAGSSNQKPQHTVFLDAYYIDKFEVTNAEFEQFMAAGGYTMQAFWSDAGWSWRTGGGHTQPATWGSDANRCGPGWPGFPVNGVSWYEAEAYANFAGKRLPTEAEWEKVARGTDARSYPWGEGIDNSRANYSGSGDPYESGTTPVGFYDGRLHPSPPFQTTDSPSPYGAYDMAGNVWEWVRDWYSATYYGSSPDTNPPGPISGTSRVLRGGSWSDEASYLRCAQRYYNYPTSRYSYNGFRCARTGP